MNKRIKVIGLLLILSVILQTTLGEKNLLTYLSGYFRTENDVQVKMVSPKIGSTQGNESVGAGLIVSPKTSALRGNESGIAIEGNVYSQGVGGKLNEGGMTLYLTPEKAFKSYKKDITAYDTETTKTTGSQVQLTTGWNLISLPINL